AQLAYSLALTLTVFGVETVLLLHVLSKLGRACHHVRGSLITCSFMLIVEIQRSENNLGILRRTTVCTTIKIGHYINIELLANLHNSNF
ncbi:MAG: hypothetical protein ACKO96_35990, partial [Flammeovirgaceae bacterium]